MSKSKRNSLLFLSAAGILTLLLATSLSTLSLSPGKSFSLGKTDVTMPGVAGSVPGGEALLWMFRGLMALTVIFLSVYIIYSLFSARGRQRLVMNLLVVLLLFWFANYLDKQSVRQDDQEQAMTTDSSTTETLANEPPEAVLSEGEAPPWLAAVVILVAAALGVGLLVASLWFFRQRTARDRFSLNPLAEAAQDTLESLQAGGDFRTAIIRCYHEMNRVVKEERGLARETAMTPREFETYLVSRGFPRGALETLTRLFERRPLWQCAAEHRTTKRMALACLTEIVKTCQPAES